MIDIVQIISFNGMLPFRPACGCLLITIVSADYGESHYVGPIKGAQPNSHAWVDGFPHEPWLHLASYYARAFKSGVYPPIETDTIYMWARPHLKTAVTEDAVPRPQKWELVRCDSWCSRPAG